QQTWATGFVLQDDPTTTRLDFKALRDFVQLGTEFKVMFSGKVKKFVSYAFFANFMMPFFTNVPTQLQGFDLLNADIQLKIGFDLAKWASLNYLFRALRVPLLTTNWQVTNNLVLTFTTNLL
ncbi:MAG: hypothetical protein AAGJ35_11740, partial [Myxococcota bacterium]